ncbi:MAG: FAD:protein FMN transferase [Clostridia bacterium]|nr:FAD:protein FMN transferase [Clostridia bacterium]
MSKNKTILSIIMAVLVLLSLSMLIYTRLNSDVKPTEVTTFAMGSYISQTVYGEDGETAAKNGAVAVNRLEELISWKIADSDVYNINLNAGKDWVQVSPATENILNQALSVCKASKGAFDITVLPLSRLWDFDNSPTAPPSEADIDRCSEFVDYTALRYDANTSSYSFKSSAYAVDLGSVGKGAACDAIIAEYKALNVDAAIVAVGGSVGTLGTKKSGKWNIAVRDPDGGDAIGVIQMGEGYCSTSGSYEKNFEYEGKLYHHILDPKTGYPKQTDVVSVTIVCDTGAVSDALSTACFNLGWEESQAVLEQFGAEAIFIYDDGTIKLTEGIRNDFRLTESGKLKCRIEE